MSSRLNLQKLLEGLKHPSSDGFFRYGSLAFAGAVVAVIVLSLVVLAQGAFPAFTKVGVSFLNGTNLDAATGFCGLPYIFGTLLTALITILIWASLNPGI